LAYGVTVLGGIWLVPPFDRIFNIPFPVRVAAGLVALIAFLYLVASIFVIKPTLYDIFLTQSGCRMKIKGAQPFLESVIAANPGNVDTVA
jgi:hypothetical protein